MSNLRPVLVPNRTTGVFSVRWIYAAVAIGLLLCGLAMQAAGLAIAPSSASNAPYGIAALVAAALRIGSWRSRSRWLWALGDCAEYYALLAAICLTGAVASYAVAAATHDYADPALQHVDEVLRFDWLAWYRTVAQHPALQLLGVAAYQSIYLTPAVLLGWFAFHGRRDAALRFLAVFWVAAVMTLAAFSLMPAVGPLSYLWHGPMPYMPVSELWQPDLIPALRAHTVHLVDLGQLHGLVSAPSFHTASATLYICTAWRIRRLRWPLVLLNLAMLLSTPVEGTHYLIDMILGAAVALCALLVVRLALGPFEPTPTGGGFAGA